LVATEKNVVTVPSPLMRAQERAMIGAAASSPDGAQRRLTVWSESAWPVAYTGGGGSNM
jgi:hypothetical protein